MKKLGLVAILGAFLALPAVVEAQEAEPVTAMANVSASVVEALSVTTVDGSVDFGDMLTGSGEETVEPADGAAFIVNGTDGQDIVITAGGHGSTTNLSNDDDETADDLVFQAILTGGSNALDDPNPEDGATTISNNGGGELTAGTFYLYLGGLIDFGGEATPGNYTGTHTITIEYDS